MKKIPVSSIFRQLLFFVLAAGCAVLAIYFKSWWPMVAAGLILFLFIPAWWSILLVSFLMAFTLKNFSVVLIGVLFAVLGKPKRWWPVYAGIGFALVQLLSFMLSDRPLGITRGYTVMGAMFEALFMPDHAGNVSYWGIYDPAVDWTCALILGVIIGSLISSRYSGEFKLNFVPEIWKLSKGPSVIKRWVWAFVGGALIGFAARIAGGCVSGLLISATIQMAPAGFIFMFALWIGGLVTTMVFYRSRTIAIKRD